MVGKRGFKGRDGVSERLANRKKVLGIVFKSEGKEAKIVDLALFSAGMSHFKSEEKKDKIFGNGNSRRGTKVIKRLILWFTIVAVVCHSVSDVADKQRYKILVENEKVFLEQQRKGGKAIALSVCIKILEG